jgi:hypothetical protein
VRVGDLVECLAPGLEVSSPVSIPLVQGQRYRVLGTRSAGLVSGTAVHEIQVQAGTFDGVPVTPWYGSWRFRVVESTNAKAPAETGAEDEPRG